MVGRFVLILAGHYWPHYHPNCTKYSCVGSLGMLDLPKKQKSSSNGRSMGTGEAMSLDKFKSDLHIEMASKGCVSGTLSEWPMLRKSLRDNGLHLDDSTDAITLRKICSLIVSKCDPLIPLTE